MRPKIKPLTGGQGNKAGVGGALPGDKAINNNISIDFIPPQTRYKFNAKPGEVRNPSGSRGYKGLGLKKPVQNNRSPEHLRLAMEHRELTEICRMEAREAIEKLKEIIRSDTAADTAKLTAIGMLMDRGYGKATQTNVNTQVSADGNTTEIDDRELNKRIEDAIKRIEAATGRAPEAAGSEEQPPELRKFH